MDEKQTNDAKQVMLVQQADDGRIRAVTGMDSVGNLHTVEPTQQNVSNLLNVNTQDAALETFFKKFMQEAETPSHTGIFIMTQSALERLIQVDFDPQTLEQYRANLNALEDCDLAKTLFRQEIEEIFRRRLTEMLELSAQIFIANRFEEMTYQQIADRYGISVRKVTREIQRCLKLLREDLGDYLPVVLLVFPHLMDTP